ncbi:MAG: hypothetical protein JKY29_14285 [Gammaproteobacteria bacterium]|nr:hypothetical protein [Gammaproteobacteria bacterium]
MHSPIHEESLNGHVIKIYHDGDVESPRDWDNLGTLICGHTRYNLGDEHSFDGGREFLLDLCDLDVDSELSVDELAGRAEKYAVILPAYLYDHSGLVMNTTGFHCPWDSGQVGFIYATLDTIRKEYSVARVSAKLRHRVAEVLKQEVATYSDYLNGNTYGYVIEQDGDEIEACWGFIGDYDGNCLEEARASMSASSRTEM